MTEFFTSIKKSMSKILALLALTAVAVLGFAFKGMAAGGLSFNENFETYTVNQTICNQGNWTCAAQASSTVSVTQAASGTKSIFFSAPSGSNDAVTLTFDSAITHGMVYLDIYGSAYMPEVAIVNQSDSRPAKIDNDAFGNVLFSSEEGSQSMASTTATGWHTIGFKWDDASTTLWGNYDNGAWFTGNEIYSISGGVKKIRIAEDSSALGGAFFLDNIRVSDLDYVNTIEITSPADQSSNQSDFNDWVAAWTAQELYDGIKFEICWGNTYNHALACDQHEADKTLGSCVLGFPNTQTSGSISIPKSGAMEASTTYAVAYMYQVTDWNDCLGETTALLAQSPVISFYAYGAPEVNATSTFDYGNLNQVALDFWDAHNPIPGSTSTIVYTGGAAAINFVLTPIGLVLSRFAGFFSTSNATDWGNMLGSAIGAFWSYMGNLNSIGNFPLLTIILLLVILNLATIVFGWVWKIWKMKN